MIKTGYAYLFFFLYKHINSFKNNILVHFKAVAVLIILEIALLGGIAGHAINIFKLDLPENRYSNFIILTIVVPIVGLKFWFFERNENWRKYLAEFGAWPEEKRKKWDLAMRVLIAFIFGNFILSYYIMSEIDWDLYR